MSLPNPNACRLCGTPIQSKTGRYCVTCYRQCLAPCRECLDDRTGKLKYRYQEHEPKPGDDGLCKRCGVRHVFKHRLPCPKCKGERQVFTLPEAADAQAS